MCIRDSSSSASPDALAGLLRALTRAGMAAGLRSLGAIAPLTTDSSTAFGRRVPASLSSSLLCLSLHSSVDDWNSELGLANLDLDLFLDLWQGESTKSWAVDGQESSGLLVLSDWVEVEGMPPSESQNWAVPLTFVLSPQPSGGNGPPFSFSSFWTHLLTMIDSPSFPFFSCPFLSASMEFCSLVSFAPRPPSSWVVPCFPHSLTAQ